MEAWREVEVAACEELPLLLGDGDGPTEATWRRSARRRSPSRRSTSASARPTTTWRRSSTCSPPSAGEAGRWIHFGLTSSDVLDTALALQLKAAGEAIVPGHARSAGAGGPRAGARGDAMRGPHARGARRADDVRREAGGLGVRGPPQRATPGARLRAGVGRRGSRARWAPTRPPARSSRRVCWRASGWRASRSPPRWWRATATRSC